jgi:DnaK suppressor protein
MNKAQLKKFRSLLEEKREEIVRKAKQTLDEDMTLDADDLPDEMDLASSEYLQSFTFRLRGREKSFLDKINKALVKIDDGSFGICEECSEEISLKRLEARPETTLCIRCKEDQERAEKDYGLGRLGIFADLGVCVLDVAFATPARGKRRPRRNFPDAASRRHWGGVIGGGVTGLRGLLVGSSWGRSLRCFSRLRRRRWLLRR